MPEWYRQAFPSLRKRLRSVKVASLPFWVRDARKVTQPSRAAVLVSNTSRDSKRVILQKAAIERPQATESASNADPAGWVVDIT